MRTEGNTLDRAKTLVTWNVETGDILVKPPEGPENQNWLARRKAGLGRASKNEWEVISEVGPEFFEKIDKSRDWHFSFEEYYDLYVWDLEPGQHFSLIYNTIHDSLVKSLRCAELKDMYLPAAAILKSLARDSQTSRTRDAKDGEETIFDMVGRGKSQFVNLKQGIIDEDQHEEIFYSEADAPEDMVLFPDEHLGGNALFEPEVSAVEKMVGKVPNFLRFAQDLDTDEETEPSDVEEESANLIAPEEGFNDGHELAIRGKARDPKSSRSDTGSSRVEDSESESEDERFEYESSAEDDPNSADYDISRLKGISSEDKADLAVLNGWQCPQRWGEGEAKDEFMTFLDREKSIAFKKGWHEADLTPNAETMYKESARIVKHMEKFHVATTPFKWCHDLRLLDVHPDTNRKVVPDIEQARAMMMLFFSSEFLTSKHGEAFKDSLLLNQSERASQGPPKIRSHNSNATRPKDFWKDWDDLRKQHRPFAFKHIPRDWDNTIRPIVAKLFKAGVIGSAHLPYPPGIAIARKEPDRDPDLYFDFREIESQITFPAGFDRTPPSKEQLLSTARNYSKSRPHARFALLRLWSAPHFYPLMLGYDRRAMTSFADITGRSYEWKFIPKCMPCSELSMHHTSKLRIKPFQCILGKNVVVSRNLFLVMGENEPELSRFAVATTFAIQTNPWRLEVDLWKSFVNIDLEFLEGLAEKWMD